MATHSLAVLRDGFGQRIPPMVGNHLLLNGVVVHTMLVAPVFRSATMMSLRQGALGLDEDAGEVLCMSYEQY